MHATLSTSVPDTSGLRAVFTCLVTVFLVTVFLAGCSPSLNWRESHPKGLDVLVTFPCKPQQVSQSVKLGSASVSMSMTGCEAAGMTFALAHANVGSAERVAPALSQMHRDALANVAGRTTASRLPAVAHGRSDVVGARDIDIAGRGPDGKPLKEHVVMFAQGTQVYQATVLGTDREFNNDAARTFTASIRLPVPR